MNKPLHDFIIDFYNGSLNEGFDNSVLLNDKIKVRQITSNNVLFNLINNNDFIFMQEQIQKDDSYHINGGFDIQWFQFYVNNNGKEITFGLIGLTPYINARHDDDDDISDNDLEDILYIACVEISKNAKEKLNVYNNINKCKESGIPYKPLLNNIIEWVEQQYSGEYFELRLSTESDSPKLRKCYEQCGFKVVGETMWGGYIMNKDI